MMRVSFGRKYVGETKGFTLVELMIVIAIIGLLSVVLIPKIGKAKDNVKNAGVSANMRSVQALVVSLIDDFNDWVQLKNAIAAKIGNAYITNPYNGSMETYNIGISATVSSPAVWIQLGGARDLNGLLNACAVKSNWRRDYHEGVVHVEVILTYDNKLAVGIFGYGKDGWPITTDNQAIYITQ